jgi:hypothetical protein
MNILSLSCVGSHRQIHFSVLFKILILPNLRKPQSRRVVLEWPHQEFKACLARSNCPLECLIFGAGVATDEQRAECIALDPSLEVVVKPFKITVAICKVLTEIFENINLLVNT